VCDHRLVTHTRIYLVGFMGAGKSSVGRQLAKRLGWKFADLDREIERTEHQSIPEIFERSGEPYFREVESKCLQALSRQRQVVVALGGGAFADPANRELAAASGLTVWLKVSFATVVTRVKMDGSRPKFGSKEQAEALYNSRQEFYSQARVHIESDNRSPASVADELAELIRSL
jgi:shikimate kinase